MKEVFKIYIFRHGQTFYNRDKIFTGWKDSKLTVLGVKQAKFIGEKLKNKQMDIAFQTKLSRSKDTLKEVLKFHPECRELIEANHMIERSYGLLEGLSHKRVIGEYGEEKFDQWHRSWNIRPPKGECFADVEKRVKLFVKDLKKFIKKEKVNVAISAHGNSIRLFRKIMEGLSIKETCELTIPYDKVFEYELNV
jgi:2,3-bisphosphoglycerate-dependent phosphoglycerate mutase